VQFGPIESAMETAGKPSAATAAIAEGKRRNFMDLPRKA